MATYQVLCWQEIPSIVEARDEKGVHKEQLSPKFQALIDQAAMVRKLAGTDAYLDEWNKTPKQERPGSADEVAKQLAGEFEANFPKIRDEALKRPAG
ncbi:MAG: hypothetical protein EXQ86_09235 [Rhodospirillales bacterium]|nr:hypothetical protein [Rhodospirillales bacterium]